MDPRFFHMLLAAGAVVIEAIVIVRVYRALVSNPIRRIRDGAERLAAGDHDHRIQVRGARELTAIAAAINRMAEEVSASHVELERQVAERTEDLRAVLEEVHERSRIAEEVNLRLADSDRRKTEFLTNVSHELRTPLNAIVGFLRLLQDGLYESEEERHEFLENARRSADHMLHLVKDVLSAAQIEAGRLAVNLTTLHPADVIFDVLRILEVRFREKGVRPEVEVEGALMVVADELKLRQVLLNLLGNAIRYTEEGRIIVRARKDGEMVRVEIEDTGEGIPEDELERIFEKFHQVDRPAARHRGGTGLGLSVARELVQLMGGEISAHSDGLRQGSVFHFTLRAVADRPQRKVEDVQSAAS